jgi:hypothetical protein
MVVADTETEDTETEDPEERLNSLLGGFCEQADAGEIRAAGYCVEMKLHEDEEHAQGVYAIYMCLEDGSPRSRKLVYPFHQTGARSYKLEKAFTEEGEAIIFHSEDDTI